MNTARRTRVPTIVAAALALIVTAGPAPAAPDPNPVQEQVDGYLTAHPGGTQITSREISYGGGRFIVAVAPPVQTLGGPDCPSGWFCFYDGLNYGYPRGRLSSCGWQDLAWWNWHDRTESAHYNLSSGTVWFINHTPGITHANDVALFDIGTSRRTRPDVAPYRNMADHVYRFCA